MDPSDFPESAVAPTAAPPDLSLLQRAALIFVRPAAAWTGLRERAQWWFPLLLLLLVTVLGSGILYSRAYLPDMLEAMEDRIASGELTAEHVQKIEEIYRGPAGVGFSLGAATVAIVVITFLVALLVWFAVGFILGSPFRYRHALEVTAWSSLVTLPPAALSYLLAWFRQSMRGVHVGFGILTPEAGPDDKMLRSLAVFLDWIGPFGIWHVVVAVLGAAYLSGAPRRSVAWALGALYVVSGLVAAALAAMVPGGV
jgi:hypothetical protein